MNVATGADAVAAATKWLGTPYQWGGGHGGPVPVGTPVDCSGLVDQVFGITGNTGTQIALGTAVNGLSSAQPGDLVFFGPLAPGEPFHVGIYTGAGMMIDAPHTGSVVRRDTVAGFGSIDGIRRLVPPGSSSGSNSSVSQNGNVQYTYAQLECVWTQAGGSPQNMAMAAAIAMAESGGNANASNTNSNGSIDRGLWQINSSNGTGSSFDVMTNARTAVQMSNNGTNWRPWCTAYSDGACGTKGGTYQGSGAPYQKFYQPNVAQDCSAPINGTNAAANNGQQATLDSESICDALLLGFICKALPGGGSLTGIASATLMATIGWVINPMIQIFAGVAGIAAGGILALFGIYSMVSETKLGGTATSMGITGLGMATGQPEVIAAGTGGIRAAGRQRLSTQRGQAVEQRQANLINLRGQQQRQNVAAQTQGRIAVKTASPQVQTANARATTAWYRLNQERERQQALTTRAQLRTEANRYNKRKPRPA